MRGLPSQIGELISRRRPLLILCLWPALFSCGSAPPEQLAAGLAITHGPILGRLADGHVGVWARTARPGEFRVFYGTSPGNLSSESAPAGTSLDHDNTGWVLIEGLESNTKYYYEVTADARPSGVDRLRGHFHTLPKAADFADPEHNPKGLFNFRFEFACGNNQKTMGGGAYGPELPTYATMLDRLVRDDEPSKVDFAILNGDWLYEEKRDYTGEEWREQVGITEAQTPRVIRLMPNVVGVWENYKIFLSRGKNLADWHRYVPSYYTFDDHELLSDVYGAGEVGRRNWKSVFRDPATLAWYDYLGWSNEVPPTQDILYGRSELKAGSDVLTDSEASFSKLNLEQSLTLHVHWGSPEGARPSGVADETGDPNSRVYEIVEVLDDRRLRIRPAAVADGEATYSIGRVSYFKKRVSNVDLFFVDTRSSREMHDVTKPAQKGLSMLGKRQTRWLKQEMESSDADFFFVVSSVNFTIPHIGGNKGSGGGNPNKDDAWTVFLDEREELINFWDSLGKPVFVLTGDLHNSFAIKVTDHVWEFASGPHNSVQHPLSSEGGRPPNGPYEYNGRKVDIRWSSFVLPDTPVELRNRVIYCVVQISNVFSNPNEPGKPRWVPYPRPQATFQYYDGLTGDLLYAESILAR